MGFLDNLSKNLSQGIDRAKFEAEKFQKVTRIQNELAELRREVDGKRMDLGDRAYDLYRAGKIQSATLSEVIGAIEALRSSIVLKEEELKESQAENFPDSPTSSGSTSQQVPISVENTPPAASYQPGTSSASSYTSSTPPATAAGTKACPSCGFQMPSTAMFCPNCGNRVGV